MADFLGTVLQSILEQQPVADLGKTVGAPIASALVRRGDIQREDENLAQQEKVKRLGALSFSILDQPAELRQTVIAGRMQEALDEGDTELFEGLRQFSQLDDPTLESELREDVVFAGNLLPGGAQAFREFAIQSSADKTLFKDKNDNFFKTTRVTDPRSGETKHIVSPVGHNEPQVGKLSLVSKAVELSEEEAAAAALKAKLKKEAEVRAAAETGEEVKDIVAETAEVVEGAKSFAKGQAARDVAFLTAGQEAADSIPVLKRSLGLLDLVKTGGIKSKAALKIKQELGIEGADEGELSANLGKAVLAQLKPIFGAQFTKEEGDRLISIEAGFGKNTATNIRLIKQTLQLAERAAERAIKIAIKRKDFATAAQLQESLDFAFQLEEDTEVVAPTQVESTQTVNFEDLP